MKNIVTEPQLVAEVLNRGVDEIIDKEHLEKRLQSGECLRVKLGIDPTSPNIHLGRSIPLLKLRDFQKLGHQIVLIIGDFTGTIGDTSDKDSERPMLSEETVQENLKNYIKQAAKIIDIDQAEIHYNSRWLGELKYKEITNQANAFSLNEFISRDNIRRRLEAGKRISLREVLYPLMQGYDSVEVKADVEIGGTDQRFNVLSGRHLQKAAGQEPQDIITNPLIEGLDGRKMSSSFGNTVNLLDEPNEMFGKIMSLKDEFIIKYFTLLTRLDLEIITSYEKELASGANPRDYKMILAAELVKMYHSEAEAAAATEYFVNTFSKKEIPSAEIDEFSPQDYSLGAVLLASGLASSKSEIRRLLEQGGIKVDSQVVSDINFELKVGNILQRGKIKFIKIV
ncbi:MAG: tyrosine--tRNA ligase [Candidatus Parcubacteria bacterium]|jgi:tyrosyl-tRNA synthetase|nr:MAG: tyrosine--tRNA ligase [Candidatus Parcubacteria bacterium]